MGVFPIDFRLMLCDGNFNKIATGRKAHVIMKTPAKSVLSTLLIIPILAVSISTVCAADAAPVAGKRDSPKLPLTEVVLYSSGVGFFQRSGQVTGRAEVDLRFKVDDINDLLKSMVVQDLDGGRVSTVTYGSRDPLTKTLKSFGLDLTENPTMGQLLNQVRGERVELTWPNKVMGTILGVEKKRQPIGENREIEVEHVNVLTEDGLQSIPLPQVQKIKLLSDQLNLELRQALEVLASGHDTQKKTVGLSFEGDGRRRVIVSYIAQTPVWKTSYRLVLDDKGKPFLQGWAIVENTSDEDWESVKLALVSGRPISFSMDLYQPLYTTRPVVQQELYLSLNPQVYSDAMEKSEEVAAKADRKMVRAGEAERLGRMNLRAAAAPAPAAAFGLAMQAQDSMAVGGEGSVTSLATRDFQQSVTAAAQGTQAGELFQYQIKTPVTLQRQKSAMLPIINQGVEGAKVSIYNQSVQAKYPLNGFRLKNSTALHLMQGPLTVFEDGTYAGDARIEDLAPGQERLLSYGLDLKTEVEPQSGDGRNDIVSVKVRRGILIATRKATEERIYNVRNRDQKKKTILVEHPFRGDWQLVETGDKPERARDFYRFSVAVDADKTAKLTVKEERQYDESVQLVNSGSEVIHHYLRMKSVTARVKEALENAVKLRDQLSQTSSEKARREQRINEITQEQSRIRENMAKLNSSSELHVRYVKKLDQQETELENLRQEIETHKKTESQQQKALNDFLLNLSIE